MNLIDMRHLSQSNTFPGATHGVTLGENTCDPMREGAIDTASVMGAIEGIPAEVYMLNVERGWWGFLAARPTGNFGTWITRARNDLRVGLHGVRDAYAEAYPTGEALIGAYMPFRSEFVAAHRTQRWIDTVGWAGGDFLAPSLYVYDASYWSSIEAYVEAIVQVSRMILKNDALASEEARERVWPVVSHRWMAQGDVLPVDVWKTILHHLRRLGVPGVIWWAQSGDPADWRPYEDEMAAVVEGAV